MKYVTTLGGDRLLQALVDRAIPDIVNWYIEGDVMVGDLSRAVTDEERTVLALIGVKCVVWEWE